MRIERAIEGACFMHSEISHFCENPEQVLTRSRVSLLAVTAPPNVGWLRLSDEGVRCPLSKPQVRGAKTEKILKPSLFDVGVFP
jgi:hypothetical protein